MGLCWPPMQTLGAASAAARLQSFRAAAGAEEPLGLEDPVRRSAGGAPLRRPAALFARESGLGGRSRACDARGGAVDGARADPLGRSAFRILPSWAGLSAEGDETAKKLSVLSSARERHDPTEEA